MHLSLVGAAISGVVSVTLLKETGCLSGEFAQALCSSATDVVLQDLGRQLASDQLLALLLKLLGDGCKLMDEEEVAPGSARLTAKLIGIGLQKVWGGVNFGVCSDKAVEYKVPSSAVLRPCFTMLMPP